MNAIQQLQNPESDQQEKQELAISLLRKKMRHDVLLAALKVLANEPPQEARPPLLDLYRYLAQNGVRRDPGTFVRGAILNALRSIARQEDTPLLLEAVQTYEFLPPSFSEEAVILRSSALVCLNEIEAETTSYHAARLLFDKYQGRMSGEPGTTAAHVLASRGETLPLYTYVIGAEGRKSEETSAEILRSLTAIPVSLISEIVHIVSERANPVEMIGLIDLLLTHEEGPLALDFLRDYLGEPADLDVYRYLIIAALMTRNDALIDAVCVAVAIPHVNPRRSILLEALEPFSDIPCVQEALHSLESAQ
jgi:hypothetical protein